MQHHPPRAMIFVLLDIEEARRVGGPHRFAGRVLDAIAEVRLAREVAHADRVHLRALVVGAPGEPGVVGRPAGERQVEEPLALGARVAVDEDRLLAAAARLAADRCGAGRRGGSANNRRRGRRSAGPRCRPPSAARASRARAGAAGRGSAPARRRHRRSPLRAGRGCRRAASRDRAAPRASCRRGSRHSRRSRRRRGRGVAAASWRRSAASARRAALLLSWRRGSHRMGDRVLPRAGRKGKRGAASRRNPPGEFCRGSRPLAIRQRATDWRPHGSLEDGDARRGK